ncbi:unnamed protein product [Leptosia nina]|uniref:Integrase catalytic domain-containing protein n=1 Tax=Leptosia nina TaxID=320188 RepID=A0AAV1JUI6_9NEOP
MIVSDNGPQFTSTAFKEYCEKQGMLHIRSSPYHPQTNGLAERLVRSFKNRMSSNSNEDLSIRLNEFLFNYRNTPHTTTGKAPAEIMFGRRLNCLLSNIRPNPRQQLSYQRIRETIEQHRSEPNFNLNILPNQTSIQDKKKLGNQLSLKIENINIHILYLQQMERSEGTPTTFDPAGGRRTQHQYQCLSIFNQELAAFQTTL